MRAHRFFTTTFLVALGVFAAPAALAGEWAPPAATTGSSVTSTPRTAAPTPAEERSSVPTSDGTSAGTTPPAATLPATPGPTSSIRAFDCTTLSAQVVLDNTSSASATTFVVRLQAGAVTLATQEEVVEPGSVIEREISLTDNSSNELVVHLPGGTILATSGPVFCGVGPRVSIGAFDCSALQAPVTLDNSSGGSPMRFEVDWFWSNTDYDQSQTYTVPPRSIRVVQVPLVDHAWTSIWVHASDGLGPRPGQPVTTRGLCGLEPGAADVTVTAVDCTTRTLTVTIDTRESPPRRPRSTSFDIATTYGGTRDYFRSVEGEQVHTLSVPVRPRAEGRLTVVGRIPGATPDTEVLYSAPLSASCASTPRGTVEPPAAPAVEGSSDEEEPPAAPAEGSSDEEELAASGGPAASALVLGLALVAGGTLLTRLSKERPTR